MCGVSIPSIVKNTRGSLHLYTASSQTFAVMVGGTDSAVWFGQPELQDYQLFGVNRHDDTAWEI